MSDTLSQNIADSIVADPTGIELVGDIAEFTIDQLLSDGLLKDIPWVGWLFRAKSIYSSTRQTCIVEVSVVRLCAFSPWSAYR
jgi:hypothetical protein